MNAKELAAKLNGRERRGEINYEEAKQADKDKLVIVYGSSVDIVEFEGAICDNARAVKDIFLDEKGIIPDFDNIDKNNKDELRSYFIREGKGKELKAIYDAHGYDYSWTYETDIPHETFDIMEDGEKYCRGIVFSIIDLS